MYWKSLSNETLGSRDSAVSIATGYGLDDRGGRISSLSRVKNFPFSMLSKSALGPTQPSIQLISGALAQGVKRPGRDADHSLPTSAEVKKTRVYTTTPP
jgi:hypothetical protein